MELALQEFKNITDKLNLRYFIQERDEFAIISEGTFPPRSLSSHLIYLPNQTTSEQVDISKCILKDRTVVKQLSPVSQSTLALSPPRSKPGVFSCCLTVKPKHGLET